MPSCTFLMGYVLDDIVTDGRDMVFSWFWILDCVLLRFVQGRFERYSREASTARKNVLNYCPKGYDIILQVLLLKNKTTTASRA